MFPEGKYYDHMRNVFREVLSLYHLNFILISLMHKYDVFRNTTSTESKKMVYDQTTWQVSSFLKRPHGHENGSRGVLA